MAIVSYTEALNEAFEEEMRRDETVVMWGEDLFSYSGVMGHTGGIFEEFGGDRIKETPICEQAIAGMATGAAQRGLRPIGFFMNAGFMLCAMDGLFLKMGCIGNGLPIVMCGTSGGPWDVDHGISPEALFAHAPHLKIALPATPYDAKGLMKTAIRTDDPVMFFDHAACHNSGYSDGSSYTPSGQGSIVAGGNRQEIPCLGGPASPLEFIGRLAALAWPAAFEPASKLSGTPSRGRLVAISWGILAGPHPVNSKLRDKVVPSAPTKDSPSGKPSGYGQSGPPPDGHSD